MKEYSSFLSEHTTEFVLVPKLTKILKQKFEIVIPIFPWMTREGNNFSRSIHKNDKFLIVGLYPKRPKLNLTGNEFQIKINKEFLNGAKAASKINIPMIVGCPLAENLWDLDDNAKCIWIKLTDKTNNFYYVEYEDKKLHKYKILQTDEVLNEKEDILKFVINGSKEFDYGKLILAMQTIKANSTVYFMGFGTYKPVYFLLKKGKY
jgi:biopolymer transport protein ExbD